MAVVDAVAASAGNPVRLYGHSHGGIVAFGAAKITWNIDKPVLYEGWLQRRWLSRVVRR